MVPGVTEQDDGSWDAPPPFDVFDAKWATENYYWCGWGISVPNKHPMMRIYYSPPLDSAPLDQPDMPVVLWQPSYGTEGPIDDDDGGGTDSGIAPYGLADVNYDGNINILDVVVIVGQIINESSGEIGEEEFAALWDITQDGTLNVLDIVALVAYILETSGGG